MRLGIGRPSLKCIRQHRSMYLMLTPHSKMSSLTNPGCWFPGDKTAILVVFVARWIIIAICLIVYGRLFSVIHRTHGTRGRLFVSSVLESTAGRPSAWSASNPEPRSSRVGTTPQLRKVSSARLICDSSGLTWNILRTR
jgi:hypothetical protein